MNSNQVELSDVMKVIEDLVNAKSSLFEKLKDLRVAVSQEKESGNNNSNSLAIR